MNRTERIVELMEKAAFGELTAGEEAELKRLEAPGATDAQKDLINNLLDQLGAEPEEYDILDVDDLTLDEASEAIDGLLDAARDAESFGRDV
jgi:hypothetical protein